MFFWPASLTMIVPPRSVFCGFLRGGPKQVWHARLPPLCTLLNFSVMGQQYIE